MGNILQYLAAETHGGSYRTTKLELDAENPAALIDYDAPPEIRYGGFF
ncbi:MAG: hypothetical protein SR3Q1_09955 [Quinella sp. 3Q1]|nr:hypothetical protein [Quinella sp. 3Q1]MBR6887623.1 hypothetical protein [Selenomonadaceae bacterium]